MSPQGKHWADCDVGPEHNNATTRTQPHTNSIHHVGTVRVRYAGDPLQPPSSAVGVVGKKGSPLLPLFFWSLRVTCHKNRLAKRSRAAWWWRQWGGGRGAEGRAAWSRQPGGGQHGHPAPLKTPGLRVVDALPRCWLSTTPSRRPLGKIHERAQIRTKTASTSPKSIPGLRLARRGAQAGGGPPATGSC